MDRSLLAAGAVSLTAVVFALVAWPSPAAPPPVAVTSGRATALLTVHVSGAVVRPGLVQMEVGDRVADAIVAAGGATAEADLGALNLAAVLADGSRLVVPGAGMVGDVVADGRVRVNTASAADLQALPGVGPVLAQRIVAHRESAGPFESVEDLLDVPGIGEAKLAGLRDVVLVP